MLRACFREGRLFVRPVGATHDVTVEEYTLKKDDTAEIKAQCEAIQSGLKTAESLVRAALIHAGERDLFFLTAHHTIVDGISWRVLLADLETAYGQLLSGKPLRLPAKTHTYQDYARAMKEYRDSYALSLEIPYWQETVNRLLAMDTSDNKDYGRHFRELQVSLDQAGTEKLLSARLSVYNLEINDLLLSAVGRSYRNTFGKDSVSLQLEGHGRENLGRELLVPPFTRSSSSISSGTQRRI